MTLASEWNVMKSSLCKFGNRFPSLLYVEKMLAFNIGN